MNGEAWAVLLTSVAAVAVGCFFCVLGACAFVAFGYLLYLLVAWRLST